MEYYGPDHLLSKLPTAELQTVILCANEVVEAARRRHYRLFESARCVRYKAWLDAHTGPSPAGYVGSNSTNCLGAELERYTASAARWAKHQDTNGILGRIISMPEADPHLARLAIMSAYRSNGFWVRLDSNTTPYGVTEFQLGVPEIVLGGPASLTITNLAEELRLADVQAVGRVRVLVKIVERTAEEKKKAVAFMGSLEDARVLTDYKIVIEACGRSGIVFHYRRDFLGDITSRFLAFIRSYAGQATPTDVRCSTAVTWPVASTR